MKTYSMFAAIVGRPNVGKSTLLNSIMQEKIAITSSKPQTTRHRISGIYTKENKQIVFIDTPGMHKGKDLLNINIDKLAVSTLKEVDVILFVVDRVLGKAEEHIINYFKQNNTPVYLVINKIDTLDTKHEIDEIIVSYIQAYDFKGVYPISAKELTHVDRLVDEMLENAIEGPFYYPEDQVTDQEDEVLMKELIREKILYHTKEEVPHAVDVLIEKMSYNVELDMYDISALIFVERRSQKIILLGKQGRMMKKIGREARLDINKTFKIKTHLEIWIKVKKDWRNTERDLKTLGYETK